MHYALLLNSAAFNLLFLSGPDQALSEAEESLKCFENLGSRWGQSWGLWLLHLIDMLMGNPTTAENKLRTGLDLIHGMDIGLNEGQLKISLSMVLIQKRQFEEAQEFTHRPGRSRTYAVPSKTISPCIENPPLGQIPDIHGRRRDRSRALEKQKSAHDL